MVRKFRIKSSRNNYRSSKEEKQPEWPLESTSEEVIEEEIQHVRDKVDKLEKKLKNNQNEKQQMAIISNMYYYNIYYQIFNY